MEVMEERQPGCEVCSESQYCRDHCVSTTLHTALVTVHRIQYWETCPAQAERKQLAEMVESLLRDRGLVVECCEVYNGL